MKKIAFLFLLIFIVTLSHVHAGPMKSQAQDEAAGTSCPPFYADTNVLFSWDGDHDSGTNYACDSSGNALQGTDNGLPTGTSYGEGAPDIGALIDTLDENFTWSQTAQQYINETGTTTVWLRIYVSAIPAAGTNVYEGNSDNTPAQNWVGLKVRSGVARVEGQFEAGGILDQTNSQLYTAASWIDVAHSWDYNSGTDGDMDVNVPAGWAEDADILDDAFVGDVDEIVLGEKENGSGVPGGADYIYVTQMAVMSGYKTAKPTNW